MNCQYQNFQNPNVIVCPPTVSKCVNVVHRYQVIEQPHIYEVETRVINHVHKHHTYIPRPYYTQVNEYTEDNNGYCPRMGNGNNNGTVTF